MTQSEFDFSEPSPPTGKLGAIVARLLMTNEDDPVTPLEFARDLALYGTSHGRLRRFAAEWIESNTPFRVVSRRAKGGALYHLYWIERRGLST